MVVNDDLPHLIIVRMMIYCFVGRLCYGASGCGSTRFTLLKRFTFMDVNFVVFFFFFPKLSTQLIVVAFF